MSTDKVKEVTHYSLNTWYLGELQPFSKCWWYSGYKEWWSWESNSKAKVGIWIRDQRTEKIEILPRNWSGTFKEGDFYFATEVCDWYVERNRKIGMQTCRHTIWS